MNKIYLPKAHTATKCVSSKLNIFHYHDKKKQKVHTRGTLHPFQQLWLLILSLLSTDDFVCKTP
jgi:hypothetical protein